MIILSWLTFSILVSIYAKKIKGRSPIGFFFISCALSPLGGFIIALVIKPNEENLIKEGLVKRCPYCSELIRTEAIVCKFCKKDLEVSDIQNV